MAEWIMVAFTFVIIFFTFQVWKVYVRTEFLTGAIESHSNLMLRIEASRGINGKPIKLVWWDPTVEKPPVEQAHGQEIDISTIYIYLPLDQRRCSLTRFQKLKSLFTLP